jgi:hypothetical protein
MDAAMAPSTQIKRPINQPELVNPNDDDYITQASRMMKPKPKKQLVKLPPGSQRKLKSEVDGTNTSIDQDFLINGNIGEEETSFVNKINDAFDRSKSTYQADLNLTNAGASFPMAIRPISGKSGVVKKKRAPQGVLRKD